VSEYKNIPRLSPKTTLKVINCYWNFPEQKSRKSIFLGKYDQISIFGKTKKWAWLLDGSAVQTKIYDIIIKFFTLNETITQQIKMPEWVPLTELLHTSHYTKFPPMPWVSPSELLHLLTSPNSRAAAGAVLQNSCSSRPFPAGKTSCSAASWFELFCKLFWQKWAVLQILLAIMSCSATFQTKISCSADFANSSEKSFSVNSNSPKKNGSQN